MTRQEILNKVWYHFVTMKRSFGYDKIKKVCVYKTRGGAKCGIGCLIPNELYDPKMDCQASNAYSLGVHSNKFVQKALKKIGIRFKGNEQFLTDIQKAHDDSAEYDQSIAENLMELAKDYKLKLPK
jgi:hypothetical protein